MFLILYLFIQDTIGDEYASTQCNPYSSPLEKCPNGEYCIRHHLECTEEYCLCPSTYHEDHGETHHVDHGHEGYIPINVYPVTHEGGNHEYHEDHHDHEPYDHELYHEHYEDILDHEHHEDILDHEHHEDILDHEHHEVQCDPYASPMQRCPNGEYCLRQHLECNEEYCVCREDYGSVTHCDPASVPLQQCPNGEYCFRAHLECNEEYCFCPFHAGVSHGKSSEGEVTHRGDGIPHGKSSEGEVTYRGDAHCDPSSVPLQQCPNGEFCFPSYLECNDEYCICPSYHHVPHDKHHGHHIPHDKHHGHHAPHGEVAHCDPWTSPLQQCPNGEYCLRHHLECNDEYCYCP